MFGKIVKELVITENIKNIKGIKSYYRDNKLEDDEEWDLNDVSNEGNYLFCIIINNINLDDNMNVRSARKILRDNKLVNSNGEVFIPIGWDLIGIEDGKYGGLYGDGDVHWMIFSNGETTLKTLQYVPDYIKKEEIPDFTWEVFEDIKIK